MATVTTGYIAPEYERVLPSKWTLPCAAPVMAADGQHPLIRQGNELLDPGESRHRRRAAEDYF